MGEWRGIEREAQELCLCEEPWTSRGMHEANCPVADGIVEALIRRAMAEGVRRAASGFVMSDMTFEELASRIENGEGEER